MPMQYNNFCECEIFSHTENIKREINDYTKESSLTEQKTNYSQLVRMCVCVAIGVGVCVACASSFTQLQP